MTMIEKILAKHSAYDVVRPGEIIDLNIDLRVARDLGGVNIIRQLEANNLSIHDPAKTFFTFDSNNPSSDKHHAERVYKCRVFARERGIHVFDIHSGIGTHQMIDKGFAVPGATLASTDPQVNILGAIGALGQGMGEKDIVTAFSKGKVWFRVPRTIKINLKGTLAPGLSAKDLALNLYAIFGANKLLGRAVEITGDVIDSFGIDSRISLASMASEMGAITFLMVPNQEVLDYCHQKAKSNFTVSLPDDNAEYEEQLNINVSQFSRMIAKPGSPFDLIPMEKVQHIGIDLAFVGSAANGRIEDLRIVAGILKNRKVAPGVIMKIMPSTDEIWTQSLQEGLIDIFKEAGAIVSNAGTGDGSEDMITQSEQGDVSISTGTKNYPGLIGLGELYLASPAVVASSAIAGYLTTPEHIPDKPEPLFSFPKSEVQVQELEKSIENTNIRATKLKGKVWNIPFDNIDTNMIYHSRYTDISESEAIANYTFSNLSGYEDFASKAIEGDIVVTGHNFGLGNSRQQAVDCFKSLGIQAIVAKSFAVIYERNAINAGLAIIVCSTIDKLKLKTGDIIEIDLITGKITNTRNKVSTVGEEFSSIQMDIYQRGGLFNV